MDQNAHRSILIPVPVFIILTLNTDILLVAVDALGMESSWRGRGQGVHMPVCLILSCDRRLVCAISLWQQERRGPRQLSQGQGAWFRCVW
jgi:hypothetical protein